MIRQTKRLRRPRDVPVVLVERPKNDLAFGLRLERLECPCRSRQVSGVVSFVALGASVFVQDTPPAQAFKIKKEALKPVLVGMGYKTKDLGNNAFEVQVPKGDETVFIAVSMSSSQAKIWLTGNFGALTDKERKNPALLLSLLEQNGTLQPTHFYVRRGRLNIGVPVDNRLATQKELKKEIDSFATDVVKSKPYWKREG